MTIRPTDSQISDIARALRSFCDAEPTRAAHWTMVDAPDMQAGWNERQPMPVASVAKVPAIMAVYDRIAGGQLDPSRRKRVSDFGATRYCSVLKTFDADATLSLREIARLALITSDNPLAVHMMSLTSEAGIVATLRKAGASQSRVTVGFGEDELGPPNRANVMTAADVSRVMIAAVTNFAYDDIRVGLENNLRNNRIPRLLPDEAVIAHKTGTLAGVINDAGVIRIGDTRFALTFLTDGQKDPAHTEDAIATCAAEVFRIVTA
ncbi:MAG: serine hydrolase [Hyphomonadaceae bacterium]|nr:serine hydrolase [Hyphomonadaceae bacterium]